MPAIHGRWHEADLYAELMANPVCRKRKIATSPWTHSSAASPRYQTTAKS